MPSRKKTGADLALLRDRLEAAAQENRAVWNRARKAFAASTARIDAVEQRIDLLGALMRADALRSVRVGDRTAGQRIYGVASEALALARAAEEPGFLLRALETSSGALQHWCEHFDDENLLGNALEWVNEALALIDKQSELLRWTDLQNRLGAIHASRYRRSGDDADLELALQAYRAIRGATSPARGPLLWARASVNAGLMMRNAAWNRGDVLGMRKSSAPCRAALRVVMRLNDADLTATARHTYAVTLSMIADVVYERKLLDEADDLWGANTAIWTRDGDPRNWARTINSRGIVAYTIGEKEGDAPALKRALEIWAGLDDLWTPALDPVNFSYLVINKSGTRRRLAAMTGNPGDLQAAVADLHQAVPLFRSGPNLLLRAELLHVLGGVEAELALMLKDGKLAAAGERHELAGLRIFDRLGVSNEAALARNNLGASLLQAAALGNASARLDRAEAHLRSATAIYHRIGTHGLGVTAQRNLLAVRFERALRQARLDQLRPMAEEIESYTEKSPPETTPWERGALRLLAANAGVAFVRQFGSSTEQERLVPHLRELLEHAALPASATVAAGLELGRVLLVNGDLDGAIDAWNNAQDRLWNVMLRADSPAERRALARLAAGRPSTSAADLLGRGVALGDELALALIRRHGPGDVQRALTALSRSRGMLRAAVSGPEELDGLRGVLRAALARRNTAEAYVSSQAALGRRQAEAAAREINAAVSAAGQAEHDFRDAVTAAGLSAVPTPGLSDIAARLMPDGVFVAFAIGEEEGAVLVLRQTAPASIEIVMLPDLTRGAVEELLAGRGGAGSGGWTGALRRFDESGTGERPLSAVRALDEAIRVTGRRLWSLAMGPLDAHLKASGVPRGGEVAIMAPGILAALPLHAAEAADGGSMFIDHWAVRWWPDLHTGRGRSLLRPDDTAQRRLLAIVDPLEDLRHSTAADPFEQFFAVASKTILRGRAATIAAVLANLPQHDYLAFSGHGIYDPNAPENSGLELAKPVPGETGRPEPDRLTVAVLRQLPPRSRQLCILAACETAMFDTADIADELEGLQSAMLDVGFAGVIAASWPVDSAATDRLMGHFCRFHFDENADRRDRTPAASLRLAQLAMRGETAGAIDRTRLRRIGSRPAFADERENQRHDAALLPNAPFWWAGFRLVGG